MSKIQKTFIFLLLILPLLFTACYEEEPKKPQKILLQGTPSEESYHLAQKHFEDGEYKKALEFHLKQLEEDLKYYKDESLEIASDYNNIGLDYDELQNYEKALEYYLKTMKIDEIVLESNSTERSTTYYNVASSYDALEEYNLAISHYEKALEVDEKLYEKYDETLLATYDQLSIIYAKVSKPTMALKYAKKALACKVHIYGEEDLHTTEARMELEAMMEKLNR